MEDALELMPEIVGDESRRREVRDQRPHRPDAGRHAAAGRDARGQGPLVGRRGLGQGRPGGRQVHRRVDDPRRARDRLQPVATSAASTPTRRRASTRRRARSRRSPRPTASSTRPSSTSRTARSGKSPMYEWHVEHEARVLRGRGLGAAAVVPLERGRSSSSYGVQTRPNEWDARWWSPIINAEHLAMRESAGIFDLSAFAIFDVVGPGALDAVQSVALRQMDVAGRPGRLHAGPVRGRRLQERPHDHAPRQDASSASSPAAPTA